MSGPADWTVRPLVDAAGISVEPRLESSFQAPWLDTSDLLLRELSYLRAEHVLLEVEVAWTAGTVLPGRALLGGLPGSGPRVRLSFDSRHGPLSYGTGRYAAPTPEVSWRHNLRAVALGLVALRRVDRYGIAPGGEQYSGWLTLPAGEPAHSAGVLLQLARTPGISPTQVVADVATFRRVYQAAARIWDPDTDGDVATWARLQRARTVLSDHHHGAI